MEEKINLVMFLDSLQRTILGEKLDDRSNEERWTIKNPIVVHTQSIQGQMSIQFFPVVFREFLADKDQPVIISYPTAFIGIMDSTVFDLRLEAQYRQIFSPIPTMQPMGQKPVPPPPAGGKAPVIQLFDEPTK